MVINTESGWVARSVKALDRSWSDIAVRFPGRLLLVNILLMRTYHVVSGDLDQAEH
jgi:hypothetical protein